VKGSIQLSGKGGRKNRKAGIMRNGGGDISSEKTWTEEKKQTCVGRGEGLKGKKRGGGEGARNSSRDEIREKRKNISAK